MRAGGPSPRAIQACRPRPVRFRGVRENHAMLPRHHESIVAVATAPGRGAVGIVRVSGRDLTAVIDAVCGKPLAPRHATYLPFGGADGEPIDQGLAIWFPAPHSYTGEAVLELQAHGGPVVLQLLLARCLVNSPNVPTSTTSSIWRRPKRSAT